MSVSQLEAYVENESGLGCWVHLPTTKEDFLEAVVAIGVTDPAKDRILVTEVEPELELLSPYLKKPFDLNELSLLSSKLETLEGMNEERFNTFTACLQAGRSNSIPEMINLLENLDSFDLQPAFTPEQYGAFHINLARDEYADMMNRLEQSTDPEEQAFFAYVAEIESHVDLASYGKMQAENENGTFTDYGYLTESAALQEVYRGPQDIPAELQVSPFQEIQPLDVLENPPMNKERFWKMIDDTRETAGDWKKLYEPLQEQLSKLTAPEIAHWQQIFDEYQSLSYKSKLWAAASIMLQGCSDDSFDYFRGWLTAQGKEVFMNALADPESLVESESVRALAKEVLSSEYTPMSGYVEAARFEEMLSIAYYAYERKGESNHNLYKYMEEIPLSEAETADIASEIRYAKDIDAKWGGFDKSLEQTHAELKAMLPKLYSMFDDEPIEVQKSAEKESVIDRLRQSKNVSGPPKSSDPTKHRAEPER